MLPVGPGDQTLRRPGPLARFELYLRRACQRQRAHWLAYQAEARILRRSHRQTRRRRTRLNQQATTANCG
jgi:hypothetical protein